MNDLHLISDMGYSRKKYAGVLWDIDGTLIDSEPLHDEAVIVVLRDMGFGDIGEHLNMLGATWEATWKQIGGKKDQLPLFEQKVASYYLDNIASLKPRSIAVDLLNQFNSLGIRQATVSNSRKDVVHGNLKHLGIFDVLGAIISVDDCVNGKPDPEPYLNAAKILGVDIRSCIAVEDSPRGAQSAQASGALTLFWPQDHNLVIEHCDIKISDISDFPWFEYLDPHNSAVNPLRGLKL